MHGQQDLQATQRIIELFEGAKEQCEEALESLPGIYAVIDISGSILKGNQSLAAVMGVGQEDLLGRSLSSLFEPTNWSEFLRKLDLISDRERNTGDFSLDVSVGASPLNFLWSASQMIGNQENFPKLFSVLGRDVTEFNRATEHSTRMQLELNTAKMVQETLFPPSTAKFGASSIAGFYESASECGGDWWHYSVIAGKLFLWIGDVTGHGVPAALVTSGVHAAVSIIEQAHLTTSKALALLNRAVGATASGQRMMTFTVVSIDLDTGEGLYSSACHEPGIVLKADQEAYSMRDMKLLTAEATLPLGSKVTEPFKEYAFKLDKGDRLFFYTDGVYDVVTKTGESWSRAIFRRKLAALASIHRETNDLVESLNQTISEERGAAALLDDVTFFAFQF